jgi:predicted nucleotidyltransferase
VHIKSIKKILKKNESYINEKFGVKKLSIFGSYVRGDENQESDIDILVDFEKGKKTFRNYMGLKFFLEDLFKKKIDLVIKDAVRPELRKYINKEALNV